MIDIRKVNMLSFIVLAGFLNSTLYIYKPLFIEKCDVITNSETSWIAMNTTTLTFNGNVCFKQFNSSNIYRYKIRYYFVDNQFETSAWNTLYIDDDYLLFNIFSIVITIILIVGYIIFICIIIFKCYYKPIIMNEINWNNVSAKQILQKFEMNNQTGTDFRFDVMDHWNDLPKSVTKNSQILLELPCFKHYNRENGDHFDGPAPRRKKCRGCINNNDLYRPFDKVSENL